MPVLPVLPIPPSPAVFFALAPRHHPRRELTLTLSRGFTWPRLSVAAGASVLLHTVLHSRHCLNRDRLNHNRLYGLVAGLCRVCLADLRHDVHAVYDLAEHRVLAVEPGSGHQGDEKLTTAGVGPGVRHSEDSRLLESPPG